MYRAAQKASCATEKRQHNHEIICKLKRKSEIKVNSCTHSHESAGTRHCYPSAKLEHTPGENPIRDGSNHAEKRLFHQTRWKSPRCKKSLVVDCTMHSIQRRHQSPERRSTSFADVAYCASACQGMTAVQAGSKSSKSRAVLHSPTLVVRDYLLAPAWHCGKNASETNLEACPLVTLAAGRK